MDPSLPLGISENPIATNAPMTAMTRDVGDPGDQPGTVLLDSPL
jgi:hypothetical protein